jgi:outer membrane protein assembly factor BamB
MHRLIARPLLMPYLLLSVLAITAAPASADDWPQWRGPRRDGVSQEAGWLAGWSADRSPTVAWTVQVGRGHAAVSIADGRAYTAGWDGQQDTVWCLDAADGTVIWEQSYPCETIVQWPGPRATPTVHEGVVYTLGQHGQLHAWRADDGRPVWSVQLDGSYNPDVDYGTAWSPLVMGDLLILSAGSGGLALRLSDGSFAWGNDGQHGACASAVPYEHRGQPGVAVMTTNPGRESLDVIGVDPRTGDEQWRLRGWPEFWGAACVDPIIRDGRLFVTTSEQHRRCARFSIDGDASNGDAPIEDWSNEDLACYTGGVVLLGDCLYAVNQRGILKCLDWETGRVLWQARGYDERGSLIASDSLLLIQTGASGELAVVRATPEGHEELRRMAVFTGNGDTFTAPVLSNSRIYCRSYAGEVVCLDVRK